MQFRLSFEDGDARVTATTEAGTVILDQWSADSAAAAADGLASRGWVRTSQSPFTRSTAVEPIDVASTLDKIVAARAAAQAELTSWTTAFNSYVKGPARQLSAIEIARRAGLHRHRVYQIWNPDLDRHRSRRSD